MTSKQYIPSGCTLLDIEESEDFARFCRDRAMALITEVGPGCSLSELLALAAPYAQIISLCLWEVIQSNK